MANETPITVIGRLVADPEMRFTPSGSAVTNFTVASTPRTFDKNTNEWKDKEGTFWRCTAWTRGARHTRAENIAETLKKGDPVVVVGEIETRTWQTKEGENRRSIEVVVTAIGKDLSFNTAPSATALNPANANAWGAAASVPQLGADAATEEPAF